MLEIRKARTAGTAGAEYSSVQRFRFGRESDGSPAAPWTWDDLQ
ncbi:hypothetical protein [Acrocarpospora phusangensis]|nr:hypothetical protein [Acrocarpospora phusangensis]